MSLPAAHPNPEAAMPFQWVAEIPSGIEHARGVETIAPYVLLSEAAGRLAIRTIGLPWQPPETFSRDAVRVPYINNNPARGLSKECVGVEALGVNELAIDETSKTAATKFWTKNNIPAAFCDDGEARAAKRAALICFAEGTRTISEAGHIFSVTNQGIVLATARVVTQRAHRQINAGAALWQPDTTTAKGA
ncbi:MAG TPA: hypothetical protein VLF62_00130 [Candidatus Saccharimonadales bacterium]|nr:hypothetical protein [Candidatus Saccharimonadales bacterium]